jgi:hypothetical protein
MRRKNLKMMSENFNDSCEKVLDTENMLRCSFVVILFLTNDTDHINVTVISGEVKVKLSQLWTLSIALSCFGDRGPNTRS